MHPVTFGFTPMNTQVYIKDEELSNHVQACSLFPTLKLKTKPILQGGCKSDNIASESHFVPAFNQKQCKIFSCEIT